MDSPRRPQLPSGKAGKIAAITTRVLRDYKPTEGEISAMTANANEIMSRLKKVVPRSIEIIFVGSVARGTQIRGSSDIDIFLLFPRSTSKKDLELKGLEYAKRIVNKGKNETFVVKYAEHPYSKILFNNIGIKADIVPAYKIEESSQMGSSVDRTQLHNRFILSHLSRKQKDDVIVLKVFLKSHNIYGANASVAGFSGYLCELLVHQYGSFNAVISRFAELKPPLVIDPKSRNEFQAASADSHKLTTKFAKQFIAIDPTDPNRNVAAAVSDEALARLVLISRMLINRPSMDNFYGPKYDDTNSGRKVLSLTKVLGIDAYVLRFKTPDIADDIVWQQLRRLNLSIVTRLKESGFAPLLCVENLSSDDSILGIFIDGRTSSYRIAKGPSAFLGTHADKFLGEHPNAPVLILEGAKLASIEAARHSDPNSVFSMLLKSSDIFPSYLGSKKAKLYVNRLPEGLAKLLYSAFIKKTRL